MRSAFWGVRKLNSDLTRPQSAWQFCVPLNDALRLERKLSAFIDNLRLV
jgi:hypothetical protein